ncbi:uncharacterized protein FIBRA_07839 [Fibroporia radiculosa]|uniref:WH1 domain-containing protein n=1 Tax=Fibroporia radiculosa TaxID=599839 RepID=J4GVP9_9APHY|nr:uncharacterized protein FIBRA_07839 [Fibroporia radiculosa]CCM05610.1 predicted protein [Fibroporia radiculosa]
MRASRPTLSTQAACAPQLSDDERHHIFSQLPACTKVLSIASARIYHAPFGAREDAWRDTGLRGMLVFGRNRLVVNTDRGLGVGPAASLEHMYWLRLIDMQPGKGVVWLHQIPDDFQYRLDKPFFHIFPGKTRMFGLRFESDVEADTFYKRVTSQLHTPVHMPRKIKRSSTQAQAQTQPKNASPPVSPPLPPTVTLASHRVDPSMISSPAPGTFVHLAHVGYNEKGHLEVSESLEPGWSIIMQELQGLGIALDKLKGHGVSEDLVKKNKDFVEGFVKGAEACAAQNAEQGGEKKRRSPHRKPVTLTP